MKTYVDQDACIACGLCVSACNAVFDFGDSGKAESQVDTVPAELEDDVRQCAEDCPTSAIAVE